MKKRNKKKINFKDILNSILEFFKTNIPFILFVLFCLINTSFLRLFTIGGFFNIKAMLFDFSSLLILGCFYFLFKKRNYIYLLVLSFVIMLINTIHGIYYSFFNSFASFELLNTISQATTQSDAIFDKLVFNHFSYLITYIVFVILLVLYNKFKKYKYKKDKSGFAIVLITGVIILIINSLFLTKTDLSRLSKLWNKEYVVERYGVIIYNIDDLYQTISTSFASSFKYEEAEENFDNFFSENTYSNTKNSYSNKYEGYNVIVFHMESIMSFLIDFTINGEEVTPNLNKLVKESMYFDNFYAQVSVGTSSDTEFTLNTSLMPVNSGTAFVSYTDRTYITLESLLKEKGYYTFSMHANKGSMWNRNIMHPSLGYDKLYDREYYEYDEETETVGLGLNDSSFLRQSKAMIDELEYDKYMGTIITLSNHTPFEIQDQIPEEDLFDVTYHTGKYDENGNEIIYDYLDGTSIGKYIQSAHYADKCLGEFIDSIKADKSYNKTLFVFYGDHPAQLSNSQYEKLVNYNFETGTMYKEGEEGYTDFDTYEASIFKKNPLLIYTPKNNKSLKGKVVSYPMGMIDVLPTIGNMINITNPYALGHDIFTIKDDNIVMFPNGNFLTSSVYYDSSKSKYKILKDTLIDTEYLNYCKNYTDERLKVSNDIIVYDLLKNKK